MHIFEDRKVETISNADIYASEKRNNFKFVVEFLIKTGRFLVILPLEHVKNIRNIPVHNRLKRNYAAKRILCLDVLLSINS